MGFGGGQTEVTQTPAPKSPEEIEAIRLALAGLKLRNQFLPNLIQQFGFGQDQSGQVSQLPPTPEQQQINNLTSTSLTGAQDAAGLIRQRLGAAQTLLPGLLRSVQASQAPRTFQTSALGAPMFPSSPGIGNSQPTRQTAGFPSSVIGLPSGVTPELLQQLLILLKGRATGL